MLSIRRHIRQVHVSVVMVECKSYDKRDTPVKVGYRERWML